MRRRHSASVEVTNSALSPSRHKLRTVDWTFGCAASGSTWTKCSPEDSERRTGGRGALIRKGKRNESSVLPDSGQCRH